MMKTTPPAWAPKSRYSDAEIAAYMASPEAKIAKWLAFEDDYLTSLEEDEAA